MTNNRTNNLYNQTSNNKISFGRKVSKDNMNKSSFKLDLSMEDEKMGKSIHANKSLKKSILIQDKNSINLFSNNFDKGNDIDECFIDNKLKS